MAVISDYEEEPEVKKPTPPVEASSKPTPKASNVDSSYAAAAHRGHAATAFVPKTVNLDSSVPDVATSSDSVAGAHDQVLGGLLHQTGNSFELLKTVIDFLGRKTDLLSTEGVVTKVNDLIWDIKSKQKAKSEAAVAKKSEPVQETAKPIAPSSVEEDVVKNKMEDVPELNKPEAKKEPEVMKEPEVSDLKKDVEMEEAVDPSKGIGMFLSLV
jgi:hypothetical protein